MIDRESYENPEIAAMINKLYIPVKVDRDERPDVDARYQSAISAISGQGGWPLTAFLTPDGKPFYGGTYFPPDDAMGRPGFKRILLSIAEAFDTRRKQVDESAEALDEAIAKSEMFHGARGAFDPRVVDSVIGSALAQFDETHGGFGQSPKFPHSSAIDLLLERANWPTATQSKSHRRENAERHGRGRLYDQIGGGFHRYSVDERWCVPHFEKMSYDNSELLKNYLHGYQVTGNAAIREIAEGIIAWVNEVLSDQERGGFYASQDADQTLDDDGDYFTWTVAEVARSPVAGRMARGRALLRHRPARRDAPQPGEKCPLDRDFDRSDSPEAEIARRRSAAAARERQRKASRRALARRPTPAVDETLYVGWNAMFVSAYLEAANVLGRADCREFALKTLDRILAEAWDPRRVFSIASAGPRSKARSTIRFSPSAALLDAYEATLDLRYFEIAERAMRLAVVRYGDPDGGGFFDRAKDAAPMGGLDVRRKPLQDSPTPGANSVAAIVLDRLYAFHRRKALSRLGRENAGSLRGTGPAVWTIRRNLWARGVASCASSDAGDRDRRGRRSKAAALEKSAHGIYRFGKAMLRVTPEKLASAALPAALRETLPHLDATMPQALVCIETTCHPPVSDPNALATLLVEVAADARGAK